MLERWPGEKRSVFATSRSHIVCVFFEKFRTHPSILSYIFPVTDRLEYTEERMKIVVSWGGISTRRWGPMSKVIVTLDVGRVVVITYLEGSPMKKIIIKTMVVWRTATRWRKQSNTNRIWWGPNEERREASDTLYTRTKVSQKSLWGPPGGNARHCRWEEVAHPYEFP